ncbi:MAG: ribonuclease H-like domain-containing protein [Candidatus Aenigmarchaeota archaeon]|nr:ribonuclease H-like domain-containing protein [Candidatus Aenigmarchaeota archaeon]
MISIENKENKIYLFGRNKRQPYTTTIQNFQPYFYVEDKNGEHISIRGKKLKKIIVSRPSQVKLLRQQHLNTWEADILYTNRYIIDEIKEIPKEEPRICYLDIETLKTKDGYESPQVANNPIASICCYDSYDKEYEQFYTKFNEKSMLQEFINYIQDKNPDIIVAWNGDGFDFPFLINRINKLGMNANLLGRGGKSYTTKYGAKIFGRVLFDLMGAYKKHFAGGTGRESWSLEYISQYELGEGKEEYRGELDELFINDREKFLKYNKRDVELLVLLNEKLHIIDFFDEIRRLASCRFEDVFMNSKTADCLCLRYAKEHNFVLPSVKQRPKNKYKGAFVHDSIPKLHKDIAVMDMKSLYPSVIIGFNISYETLDKNGEINIENKYRFIKNPIGIIPTIVKPLLNKRDFIKKEMKIPNLTTQEYQIKYRTQYALKVIANSFYGVLGFRNFRLYKRDAAEAITYISKKVTREVVQWFEERGFKIIYGDTDSVFISMKNTTIEDMEKLKNEINLYFKTYFKQFRVKDENNIFELEFEKVYKTIFFKLKSDKTGAKKKYCGILKWKDGSYINEFNLVGFESKRSDSPQIGRDFLKDILKMIVSEKQKEEIDVFIKQFRDKLLNGGFTPEELGLPMGLSKDPKDYGNTIHARASRIANERHNAQIKSGDKIKYLYLKDDDVIAFKNYLYEGYVVDYEKMCRRICDMKISPLYISLGWEYGFVEKVVKVKKVRKIKNRQRTLI